MLESTSNILFPQIDLSADEKLWLQTVYAKFEAGQKPVSAEILVELWEKVAEDFNYTNIDRRLLRNGTEITLLGVVHVDVANGILSATHRVIRFIQQLIKNNPKITNVTAEQISINTSIAKNEVKRILGFICDFRDFWNGASGDKSFGYESIQVDSEHVKRAYLSYKGLEHVIEALGLPLADY